MYVALPADSRQLLLSLLRFDEYRDREDINSVCLTVVSQLLEKYDIPRDEVGRIEVRRAQPD